MYSVDPSFSPGASFCRAAIADPPSHLRGAAQAGRRLLKQGDNCDATLDCKAFAAYGVVIDRGFIASDSLRKPARNVAAN